MTKKRKSHFTLHFFNCITSEHCFRQLSPLILWCGCTCIVLQHGTSSYFKSIINFSHVCSEAETTVTVFKLRCPNVFTQHTHAMVIFTPTRETRSNRVDYIWIKDQPKKFTRSKSSFKKTCLHEAFLCSSGFTPDY